MCLVINSGVPSFCELVVDLQNYGRLFDINLELLTEIASYYTHMTYHCFGVAGYNPSPYYIHSCYCPNKLGKHTCANLICLLIVT